MRHLQACLHRPWLSLTQLSVPITHLLIIEPYPKSTICGLFYAGYAAFDWFRGAFGETGDVLEFPLQLSRSFGSAILSRQYGMHCLGIRTRDLPIISTKKCRRTDHDAVTWGLSGRDAAG